MPRPVRCSTAPPAYIQAKATTSSQIVIASRCKEAQELTMHRDLSITRWVSELSWREVSTTVLQTVDDFIFHMVVSSEI